MAEQLTVAQQAARNEQKQTNYEIFASGHGVLRVTEHHALKRFGLKYGAMDAILIRSRDTQSNAVFVALRIEYKDTDNYTRTEILDADELTALDAALDYIIKNKAQLVAAATAYTEVTYTSRGGFKAGLYVDLKRATGEFMVVSGETAFLHTLADLKKLVEDALFKIETFEPAP
jgi:hypothetical protein